MLRCLHQQNVFLSQSHISLGNIPVQSKCSRLLFLNNISKNETIVFTWKPRPLDFGEVRVHLLPPDQNLGQGSRLIPCCPIPSHPTLLHPIMPFLISYCPLRPHPILFHPIPSWPSPSRPILCILSHPIPSCTTLPPSILCHPLFPHPQTLSLNQQVTVSPMEGEVTPEEAAPILVTLKASVHASFYSVDLICKVGTSYRETQWG